MPGSEKSGTGKIGRVLIIAGSDSGGGAGIQGDIKTVTCLGGYAATAITALTAQNTLGVFAVQDVAEDFIASQIKLVIDDIGADVIKTGMLNKGSVINIVADTLASYPGILFVLDPVMFAKSGTSLLDTGALATLKSRLIPLADIITPNIPEAEYISGISIKTVDDMRKAAQIILKLGCKSVLLKGGHLDGDILTDMLITADGETIFEQSRINTKHTHGTGCAMASAIAAGIAQGMDLKDSVMRARDYVFKAIKTAPQLGGGHGPLNHAHTIKLA